MCLAGGESIVGEGSVFGSAFRKCFVDKSA